VRRIATWLLVGAVAALGIAAGVDALRSDSEQPTAKETTPRVELDQRRSSTAQRDLAVARLREAGATGVLTYADENCRVRAITLPDLGPHPAPEERTCRLRLSAGGVLSFGRAVADPSLTLAAVCKRDAVELRSDGTLLARYAGCSPTWRTDGALTLIRDGQVIVIVGPLAQPQFVHRHVILTRRDLARDFRRARWVGFDLAVREVSWLSGRRLAAIVRARSPDEQIDFLAVFDGRRLVSSVLYGYEELADLRPSPSRSYGSARIVSPGGLVVVDRAGRQVRLALRAGSALTWSPDEEWIAEATAQGVFVFRARERNPELIYLPVVARDLVWR
jgi:hypothetical protein